MSVEQKQDGEDIVFVSRDRGFGGAIVEALRIKGDGSGVVSISGVPDVPLLVAKAVIPSASVRTLHATPVQVIPKPPAGSFIEIVSVSAELVFNSAAYDAVAGTDYLELRYTDGSGALLTQNVSPAGLGDASANANQIINPAAGYLPINAKVVAHLAGTEWYGAAGDSPLHLEILYRLRKLAI